MLYNEALIPEMRLLVEIYMGIAPSATKQSDAT